jgi:hypothetical protein
MVGGGGWVRQGGVVYTEKVNKCQIANSKSMIIWVELYGAMGCRLQIVGVLGWYV